jgi:hypothetical protein
MFATVTADVAQAAAAMTGQDAPMADAYTKGRYVGFDTHLSARGHAHLEGDAGRAVLMGRYYLPSPCHGNASWTGKRDTTSADGWGLAVIYVGQQTWGKTPRVLSENQRDALRKRTDCSTDLISADEGVES